MGHGQLEVRNDLEQACALWNGRISAEGVKDLCGGLMRRPWVVAVLVILVVGASAALIDLKPALLGRRAGGPLACQDSDCGRSATGGPVKVGSSASFGPLALRNDGDETVTLEKVELLDVDPGLEVIEVMVVEPDGRHPLVGSARGFPPTEPGGSTHPVTGYELAPAKSNADFVQILVGLRLLSPDRAGARRIAVDYRAGGVPYRAIFEDSMWLCSDPDDPNGCIDPDR